MDLYVSVFSCVSNQHCQSISFSGISAVMEQNQETISLDVLFKFALNAAQEIEHLTPQDVKYDQLVKESIEKLEHCTELVRIYYYTQIDLRYRNYNLSQNTNLAYIDYKSFVYGLFLTRQLVLSISEITAMIKFRL